MDSIYGDVDQTEMVLARFYSARQQPDEDVSNWGCRLEDLLSLAINKGKVHPPEADSMLRSMFWSGLLQYLKSITGHLYERIHDFDELRVAICRVEQDYRRRSDEEKASKKSSTPAKSAVAEDSSRMDKLTGMVNQLTADIRDMKNRRPDQQPSSQSIHSPPNTRSSQRYQQYQFPATRGGQHQHYPTHRIDANQQQDADGDVDEPTCLLCGQTGHLQYGCRVQLDHRRPLNYRKSAPRGRR